MKLSQLIAYRNALKDFSVGNIRTDVNMELDKIMHEVDIANISLSADSLLEQDLADINKAFGKFKQNFDKLQIQVAAQIKEAEQPYFEESYRFYQEEMRKDTVEQILSRKTSMSPESRNLMINRIQYYSDWKYPGMIIRPGQHDFISHMVNFDPLYIVDDNDALLTPSIAHFPEQYQRRVCRCYINEDDSYNNIMLDLPDNQFGICVAFDFFNFKPFEIVKQYLIEIHEKLRPGGTLAMTFNDCDHVAAMILVENYFSCYTPGRMILDLAEDIGYELQYHYHKDGEPITWVELRKAGNLETLRGGQTMAKIVRK